MPLRFLRPTVDSIVSNIARQVQLLHDAAERHHADVLAHHSEAARRANLAGAAANERDRATSIAAKLNALINP